jgi:ATP synthase protein I
MKKIKEISTRLKIAKSKINNKNYDQVTTNRYNASSLGIALKIGTELVAAVVVGAIIGFILDSWFGTKPWMTIFFFFIGVAAGILNVIKAAKQLNKIDNKN